MILCLSGCMIFCVAPIDEDEFMFNGPSDPTGSYYNMNSSVPAASVPGTAAAASTAAPVVVSATTAAETPTPVVIPMKTPHVPTPKDAAPSPVDSAPPKSETENIVIVNPSDEDKAQPTASQPTATSAAPSPQVDLLDVQQPSDELRDEVAPTPSEVDDLD